MVKIFKRLGLVRSFRYQKHRTVYTVKAEDGQTLQAMFDETPLGNFLELEGDSATIESVATKLGYPKNQYISESYVEMQVARCAARGVPLKDLLFDVPQPKAPKKPRKNSSPRAAKKAPKKK